MIDTSFINILDVIGSDTILKKAAATNGGEYEGSCPFCGGKDRFRVWPNQDTPRFWCRQCDRKGDAIAYLQFRYNLSFVEACQSLHVESQLDLKRNQPMTTTQNTLKYLDQQKVALTDEQWQQNAQWFVGVCQEKLFTFEGQKARDYLHQRGLSDETLQAYGIGYCSSAHHQMWGETIVFLPQGIVIPWFGDGQIRTVKFRLLTGDLKYIAAKGGAGGLYLSDNIRLNSTVVMTEGEFDALMLAQHIVIPDVVPVATGGNKNGQFLNCVVELAALSKQVLLAFDLDEAGEEATQWWLRELGSKAHVLKPTHHDITDMHKAGVDLNQWLQAALGSGTV